MKQLKKQIWLSAVRVVLTFLIFLNIGVMYLQYVNGEDSLEQLHYAVLEVTGGSMEPTLTQGDGVLVVDVDYDKLKVGDIIVFEQDGMLVTHQITQIDGAQITTQGTANPVEDSPITEEDYRAKVLVVIPCLSAILLFYSSPLYFFGFMVLMFFLIFGSIIFSNLYDWLERHAKRRQSSKR